MSIKQKESSQISLSVEFAPDEGDPSRIFTSMAQLIDSFQALDRNLLSQFDLQIRSELLLHDVERGSLKAILRNVVKDLPDAALENAEWKKIIGHYLLKGKYAILKWTDSQELIEDRSQLEPLEGELMQAAEETKIQSFPGYRPISAERLLTDIQDITSATTSLRDGESVLVNSELGKLVFYGNLAISDQAIRDILTSEVIDTTTDQTLLVKKPDYLGKSMWSFHHRGHTIEAKVLDEPWLSEFQSQRIVVHPGDAIRVRLREELFLGSRGEIVLVHYEVLEVKSVVRLVGDQGSLL